jgi:hypothetical protein
MLTLKMQLADNNDIIIRQYRGRGSAAVLVN